MCGGLAGGQLVAYRTWRVLCEQRGVDAHAVSATVCAVADGALGKLAARVQTRQHPQTSAIGRHVVERKPEREWLVGGRTTLAIVVVVVAVTVWAVVEGMDLLNPVHPCILSCVLVPSNHHISIRRLDEELCAREADRWTAKGGEERAYSRIHQQLRKPIVLAASHDLHQP